MEEKKFKIKKFFKKYWIDYFSANQKKLIIFLIIILFLATLISMTIFASFDWSKDYVKKTVCLQAMEKHTLQYGELSLIKLIILEYNIFIKLLLCCIGLGWVIHGVGFKVIGS